MSMEELQIGAGTPKELTEEKPTLPTRLRSQKIAIPATATEQINKLHTTLVANARAFESARGAFGEFLRITKRTLRVPEDERWEITEDATAFFKLTAEGKIA